MVGVLLPLCEMYGVDDRDVLALNTAFGTLPNG